MLTKHRDDEELQLAGGKLKTTGHCRTSLGDPANSQEETINLKNWPGARS